MIDCHAHLAGQDFDADRDTVRQRAAAAGVSAVLVVGEDPEDNTRVLRVLAHAPPDGTKMLPCLGFHPDRFADDRPLPTRADSDVAIAQIRKHAAGLVAIGEVGLDYWYAKDPERRRAQGVLLERMAALSNEFGLPLNVHSRSAGHYTVDLLLAAGTERVLMHAFDGKAAHAVRAAEAGFLFSVPPSVVLFCQVLSTHALLIWLCNLYGISKGRTWIMDSGTIRSDQKQKLVRRLPLESLALESDSPVLGPDRAARNKPTNLSFGRDFIAQAHGLSSEQVDEITTANALRLFPRLG